MSPIPSATNTTLTTGRPYKKGVYVLTDNAFRPFSRMSAEVGSQAVLRAQPVARPLPLPSPPISHETLPSLTLTGWENKQFLWFPCGIVRGALAAMGITATVQAETSELPSAVFQIKTIPAKT